MTGSRSEDIWLNWVQHLTLAVFFLATLTGAAQARWDPDLFADRDVIHLRTNCGDEGEHRFPVWVVVVGRAVFVRLGSRAADRVECTPGMSIGVDAGNEHFDHVRGIPSPEMAERVGKAMAAKYTADLIVRWLPHPLILRLEP